MSKKSVTNSNDNDNGKMTMELSPEEVKLIQYIRTAKWGELNQIKIQNGLPVMIQVLYRTIKLN